MKIEQREQADIACRYLEYTSAVEVGINEDAKTRDLTAYEENVRSTALSCLLIYFLRDFDPPTPPPPLPVRKKVPKPAVDKKKKCSRKK